MIKTVQQAIVLLDSRLVAWGLSSIDLSSVGIFICRVSGFCFVNSAIIERQRTRVVQRRETSQSEQLLVL